jgi:ABC-type glutathione transport system ATPase component
MNELIRIENISKYITLRKGLFNSVHTENIVSNINLVLNMGETVSIVGQSGAGKTTLAKIIARIMEPSSGKIFYRGKNVLNISKQKFQRKVQMIFQDPYSTLNPMMKIKTILKEPLVINSIIGKNELDTKIYDSLSYVGLPISVLDMYPHELSGGQRQRVAIARTLSLEPELLVCDEPLSSIDIENQKQIINVFKKLQSENISFLLIAHDLTLVKELSDYIAIMLNGKIVEFGPADKIYTEPKHQYTKELVAINN